MLMVNSGAPHEVNVFFMFVQVVNRIFVITDKALKRLRLHRFLTIAAAFYFWLVDERIN